MDSYALKQAFKDETADREMIEAVRSFPESFLDLKRIRSFAVSSLRL
jgi:hypothetical protein